MDTKEQTQPFVEAAETQDSSCVEQNTRCHEQIEEKERLIASLKSELEQIQERVRYVIADFDNFRRRSEKERQQLFDAGEISVLHDLVAVLDDFDRAFAQIKQQPEVASHLSGFELIYRALQKLLVLHHVSELTEISSFNPELHEAVMHVPEDGQEGSIAEILQKGYLYKGMLLRPAKVSVKGA